MYRPQCDQRPHGSWPNFSFGSVTILPSVASGSAGSNLRTLRLPPEFQHIHLAIGRERRVALAAARWMVRQLAYRAAAGRHEIDAVLAAEIVANFEDEPISVERHVDDADVSLDASRSWRTRLFRRPYARCRSSRRSPFACCRASRRSRPNAPWSSAYRRPPGSRRSCR